VLWANNLHALKPLIKENELNSKWPDARGDPFGMKQKTIIEFWNVNKSHKKIME
jgi:hypothetical protein